MEWTNNEDVDETLLILILYNGDEEENFILLWRSNESSSMGRLPTLGKRLSAPKSMVGVYIVD